MLRKAGHVDDAEMFRTFNMGIGYCLVVPSAERRDGVSPPPRKRRARGHALGEIIAGERGVELV